MMAARLRNRLPRIVPTVLVITALVWAGALAAGPVAAATRVMVTATPGTT
jgi:hypothetical protein